MADKFHRMPESQMHQRSSEHTLLKLMSLSKLHCSQGKHTGCTVDCAVYATSLHILISMCKA